MGSPIRSFTCLALLLVAACGPLVMIPGGALSGPEQPPPSDWSFSEQYDVVQLETRPSDPYSVNVWGVGVGDRFYIASGRGRDGVWAQHIAADPRVRLKIGENVYSLTATQTTDEAELDAFLAAAKRKYDFEPEPDQRETAVLFRLDPR